MPQIELGSEPAALKALRESTQDTAKALLARVESTLHWPGKVMVVEAQSKPLSAEEKERFARGKELYLTTCGACHQPHGNGQEGLAPPLAGSDWTTGSEQRITRIVLNGLRGPINIKGRVYEMEMPPLGILDDEQIASLLTYVRREWGHTASPISPEFVKKVRDETSKREEAWKEVELLKIP